MNLSTALLVAAVEYLSGSKSFARMVVRIFSLGEDTPGQNRRCPRTCVHANIEVIGEELPRKRCGRYGDIQGSGVGWDGCLTG